MEAPLRTGPVGSNRSIRGTSSKRLGRDLRGTYSLGLRTCLRFIAMVLWGSLCIDESAMILDSAIPALVLCRCLRL